MNPFLGIFLHAVGGLAAGSFYIPFKKVKKWGWESYWLIQGVLAWIVAPWIVASITTPNLWEVLAYSPGQSIALTYLFGALWGFGGLTFGLSMRYLGMSLGYAVALGFCAAFGTLLPPLVGGKILELFSSDSGLLVLLGVLVCLAGIAMCGRAGIRKERELTEEQKKAAIKEFSLVKGFAVAIFSGVMSACIAFAISAGKPIAQAAVELGTEPVYQNNPLFVICMLGGFTTNFLWCLLLNLKNKTIGDYVKGPAVSLLPNYLFAGLAGVIWYGQFFFYGMGTTKMGTYDYASWTIHMAFIIVFSNLWGIYFQEWKLVSRATLNKVWAGIFILFFSTVVIGLGNYLAPQGVAQAEEAQLARFEDGNPARTKATQNGDGVRHASI